MRKFHNSHAHFASSSRFHFSLTHHSALSLSLSLTAGTLIRSTGLRNHRWVSVFRRVFIELVGVIWKKLIDWLMLHSQWISCWCSSRWLCIWGILEEINGAGFPRRMEGGSVSRLTSSGTVHAQLFVRHRVLISFGGCQSWSGLVFFVLVILPHPEMEKIM